MSFNESNTIEQMILDAVENLGRTTAAAPTHDPILGVSKSGPPTNNSRRRVK
jgi:hypothetical protein